MKQQNKISDAVNLYCRVLEINPDPPIKFYSYLLYNLASDQLDVVIVSCKKQLKEQPNKLAYSYVLAISQAHKGDIAAAIATYKQVVAKNLIQTTNFRTSLGLILKKNPEICQNIWNEINQQQFNTFDESQYCYPSNLYLKAVNKYFNEVSNYKVIELAKLNKEDKLFLKSHSVELDNLKLIVQDNSEIKHLANRDLEIDGEQKFTNLFLFQENMVETGYIHSICPISGKKIKSNNSFLLDGQLGIYRFIGDQTFYLFNYGPAFKKILVYFPHLELIIRLAPGGPDLVELVNKWKALAVTYWQKVIEHIAYSGTREIVLTHGWMGSTAHHLLNDLTGINRLVKTGRINNVDKFLVGGFEYYGRLEEIFPEIPKEKILRFFHDNFSYLPEVVLDGKFFALKAGDRLITEELAKRIHKVAINKCNKPFLNELENAKKNSPLILMTVRSSGRRMWMSQVQGIASIIQKLSLDFPNLGVVLDGISRPYGKETSLSDREEEMLADDQAVVKQILELLPDNQVSVYNTIGCTMSESIAWACAIDSYIVPFGGGMAKVTYVANKPGVVYCNRTILETSYKDHWYTASQRENGIAPTYIPSGYVVDLKTAKVGTINDSYECDWKGIYTEAVKIITAQMEK